LIHVVGGAHNDGLAVLLATVGVAAMLSSREASAGAAFIAAFAIKAPAAITAPFALASAARSRLSPHQSGVNVGYAAFAKRGGSRLLLGATGAALVLGLAAYAAFGWHWLDALGLAGENQDRTSYMSIPITFARLTGLDPTAVRSGALVLYAALFIYLLVRTWQGADWLRCAAWASFALLIATAWLLPWYLIWALPLVALSRDRPLQLLTLALTLYQLPARMPL
ncbi:MAG TPA: hypothetical protein VLK89_07080, partial [Solirubrobacterales bacterium]|nr:hypothetical protein [Solirubrobacterales bacterium]